MFPNDGGHLMCPGPGRSPSRATTPVFRGDGHPVIEELDTGEVVVGTPRLFDRQLDAIAKGEGIAIVGLSEVGSRGQQWGCGRHVREYGRRGGSRVSAETGKADCWSGPHPDLDARPDLRPGSAVDRVVRAEDISVTLEPQPVRQC